MLNVMLLGAALAVVLAACGGADAAGVVPTVTPQPKWSALDAKIEVRDFLIKNDLSESLQLDMLASFREWTASYEGDGWWRVTGDGIGRLYGEVDTPTPVPTYTPVVVPTLGPCEQVPLPAGSIIATPSYRVCQNTSVRNDALRAIEYAETNPVPTPWHGKKIQWHSKGGEWLVSEKTKNVTPDNDAGTNYFRCLRAAIGCFLGVDDEKGF